MATVQSSEEVLDIVDLEKAKDQARVATENEKRELT